MDIENTEEIEFEEEQVVEE
jgi:nucleolar protein 4